MNLEAYQSGRTGAVLKIVGLQRSVGSNPTASDRETTKSFLEDAAKSFLENGFLNAALANAI